MLNNISLKFKKSSKDGNNAKKEEDILADLRIRLTISKIIFSILGIIFFVNYFFVGASFYDGFFSSTLHFTYILFLFSFLILTYYFLEYYLHNNKLIKYFFMLIAFVFFLFSLSLIFFNGGILSILN